MLINIVIFIKNMLIIYENITFDNFLIFFKNLNYI